MTVYGTYLNVYYKIIFSQSKIYIRGTSIQLNLFILTFFPPVVNIHPCLSKLFFETPYYLLFRKKFYINDGLIAIAKAPDTTRLFVICSSNVWNYICG